MKSHRPFLTALIFERDGDMNLGYLFCLVLGLAGSAGFVYTLLNPALTVFDRIAAWSFIGGAFMAVLIVSVPIAKAKVLAKSTLPSEFASSIASVAPVEDVETSTDVQELWQRRQDEKQTG